MSGTLIVAPIAPAATPTVAGVGAANLRTADPKEVWVAPSTAAITIDVDMGAAVTVDSFFLGFTNADAGAVWTISKGTGLGTGLTVIRASAAMRPADSEGPRHHAFARLAAPVTARYFRLSLVQAGGLPLYAGVLIVGLAFEKPRELGGGRMPIDTGARQDLQSGGFGVSDGVVKAQFNWSFVDITDAEMLRLWSIAKAVGLRRPALVVEDADLAAGQNEAYRYGVFDRFTPYERQDPDATRWAFTITDWL